MTASPALLAPIVAVVPAWNARSRLPEVLDALAGQVDAAVVVDNGSADDSVAWLAGRFRPAGSDRGAGASVESTDPLAVEVVANTDNLGYPVAVNQGLAHALARHAEGVLLVNDDAVFAPRAVAALARALVADPLAGAASAHMVYRDRRDVLNGAGGVFDRHRGRAALRGAGEPDRGRYDDRPTVDYPSGAASLLRRAAIEDVGTFDETFYLYFEDAEWGLRAGRAGWRTIYVPDARVVHVGSAGTAGDPARRRYYNVRNRLRLADRYASRRGRLVAWAETLALLGRQPFRCLFARRRRDAEAVCRGVADHLSGRYGRSARFG